MIVTGAALIGAGLALAAETRAAWRPLPGVRRHRRGGGVGARDRYRRSSWCAAGSFAHGRHLRHRIRGHRRRDLRAGPARADCLIDRFGWQWAFRVLGLFVVAWVIPAAALLLRDPPARGPTAPDQTGADAHVGTPLNLAAALRSWRFWTIAGVFVTGDFATQTLLVHQVAYLVDHGVSALAAASPSVSVVGLASVAGKTGWGALSDRFGREIAYTLAFACVLAGVGALAVAGAWPRPALLYVYAVLIGLGYAATAPLTPAVAAISSAAPASHASSVSCMPRTPSAVPQECGRRGTSST